MLKKIILRITEDYWKFKLDTISHARKRGVKIGANCRVYTRNFGSEPWLISIGNNVTVTSEVTILTHDGSSWLFNDKNGRRFLFKNTVIKNNIFIGVKSIIMPGVVIEDNVIIAAGSVVTKSVPSGVIVAGNPAKIIGDFDSYKAKVLTSYISESDIDYSKDYKERILEVVDESLKPYLIKQ